MTQPKDVRRIVFDKAWEARIQDEARIANEIQADHPDISRTEALRIAKEMLDNAEKRK